MRSCWTCTGRRSRWAVVGDGTSVLVFYRGAWCPYCNIALSAYQEQLLPVLAQRGVTLVAVSPQTPDGSLSMQQKNALAFTVVSDPGNAIAGRLGILTRPSDDARAAQLELGLDLAAVNADGTRPPDARDRDPRSGPHRALDRRPPRLHHADRARAGHRRTRPAARLTRGEARPPQKARPPRHRSAPPFLPRCRRRRGKTTPHSAANGREPARAAMRRSQWQLTLAAERRW